VWFFKNIFCYQKEFLMTAVSSVQVASEPVLMPQKSEEAASEVVPPLKGATVEKVQKAIDFANGDDVLTAEQLATGLGLSTEDVQKNLLDNQSDTGLALSSNPALSSIIKMLKMMFTMGVKVDKQSFQLIQAQLEAGNKSAEEAFKGAIAQFACDMVAGIVSAGVGAVAFRYSAANMGDKNYQPSMWRGPVGAQIMTAPLSSAGQFANAEGQLESQKSKNHADELGQYLQQMNQFAQTLRNPSF
jgi:hypothetical protein